MSRKAKQLIARAKAENWKRLDLAYCGLTELDTQVPELFELSQLEELVLSNSREVWRYEGSKNTGSANQLEELPTAMAKLKQLKILECRGFIINDNQIRDISVLQFLPQLTALDLYDNQISDISVLQFLTQLTSLNLGGNQISDISVLQFLTQLTSLNLGGNQISDISVLQFLTQLTSLHLYSNQISDISALQFLTQLTSLSLGR